MLCDSDMLYQVLYNLIDNAIKFTPEGGVISVGVEADGPKTYVKVRNTGEGIAPEELDYIFDRFYKTDKSRGLDKTGTGLGLYIVKNLVQRMGGDIRAESAPGEYTEFIITLRTGVNEKAKQQKVRFNSGGAKSKRSFAEVSPKPAAKAGLSGLFKKER